MWLSKSYKLEIFWLVLYVQCSNRSYESSSSQRLKWLEVPTTLPLSDKNTILSAIFYWKEGLGESSQSLKW